MATAMRTLTRLNRSSTAKQWLSNFASRGQLNAEFGFNQLARSDSAEARKFLECRELLAAKRFTSQERTYIVVTPCQFIFLKRVGETLFAKLRAMARLPIA